MSFAGFECEQFVRGKGIAMKKSVYELFFCLTAFAAAPLWGQNAQLSGTITDTSKSVVPQAAVRILSRTNGWDRKTETNNGGIYGFPSLPPGTYDLEISKEGFQTLNRTSIKLDVETHVQLDFTLKVGNTSQTITVTGDTALVQSTDASLGNVITTQAITQLPFYASDPIGLFFLQPGVTHFGGGTYSEISGAVNGGKNDQANITLDGMDVNDQDSRALYSVLRITSDSVQELRMTTSNANADMGRSSGGQLALVTKSGTNELHGSLYDYHRGTDTAANSL